MAIPDYETLMLPLLKLAGDGKEHLSRVATEVLSEEFCLTDQDKKELLSSGITRVIVNRVGWAATFLRKCQLLESTKRGFFKITQRGIDVLNKNPAKIDNKFLQQFPEFHEFTTRKKTKVKKKLSKNIDAIKAQTPEETLGAAYEELNQNLAQELLMKVKNSSSTFFEILVIDLLVKMGYGGSRKDAGQAVGKSGDEGIDGIIKRINWDSMLFIYKPRDGKTLLVVQKFKNLQVLCRAREPKKVFLLRPQRFQKKPYIMPQI